MKATVEPALLSLERRVIDVMHPGVISCPADTSLRTVARMMASYRVHAIVVVADEPGELTGDGVWGVISDGDLVRASRAPDFDELTARALAATPALTVTTVEPLAKAVQLMVEHEISHLVVVERRSGKPVGVMSTLDVARALAGA
jgi:CBS domain-containing protein